MTFSHAVEVYKTLATRRPNFSTAELENAVRRIDDGEVTMKELATEFGMNVNSLGNILRTYRDGKRRGQLETKKKNLSETLRRLFLGQSYSDIANALGETKSSVVHRLNRAGYKSKKRQSMLQSARTRRERAKK